MRICPFTGRHYIYKIRSIDARIDGVRVQLRLNDYQKPASVVGGSRHLEVVVGGENHLRQAVMQMIHNLVVTAAVVSQIPFRSTALAEKSRSNGKISTTCVESGGISGSSTEVSNAGGGVR
jgi:hypothetical protein